MDRVSVLLSGLALCSGRCRIVSPTAAPIRGVDVDRPPFCPSVARQTTQGEPVWLEQQHHLMAA
jgi:hypothetical protein